jgi:hypothetical protein
MPEAGQITAASDQGIILEDCSYWRVEGIHFKDFGSIVPQGTNDYRAKASPALEIRHSSHHVVVENCTFEDCGLSVTGSTVASETNRRPQDLLIQNNAFVADGIWSLVGSGYSIGWQRVKNQPLDITALRLDKPGPRPVVRNNTFRGYFNGVVIASNTVSDVARDADVYQNLFSQIGDDCVECDAEYCTNVRIWMNQFVGYGSGVSLSPLGGGPVWIVGNVMRDAMSYPFKPGVSEPGQSSNGFNLIYHNTCTTTLVDPESNGGWAFDTNGPMGNLVAKNNIFAGTHQRIINGGLSGMLTYTAPNEFTRNVLYSSYCDGPNPPNPCDRLVRWEQTALTLPATDAEMDADLNTAFPTAPNKLTMTDNLYHTAPLAADGSLAGALRGAAVAIDGITAVAVDGGGQRIAPPLDLGAFAGFAVTPAPVPPTGILPARWFAQLDPSRAEALAAASAANPRQALDAPPPLCSARLPRC